MPYKYDFLFISNVPSFYKIALYNELSKHCKVCAIFIGKTDQVIIDDDFQEKAFFDFHIINDCDINKRSLWSSLKSLMLLIKTINYKFMILGGIDVLEINLLSFLSPRRKNGMICESSIYESCVSGIKGILKRILFSRYTYVFPSGVPHSEIFKRLKFQGKIRVTGGVGIFNKPKRDEANTRESNIRYVYTGRLIDIKNIDLLIEVFNESKLPLTIIGKGNLEQEFKQKAKDNITFLGFVDNQELQKIYKNHDCFILPSKSEPWGLVVEEALYFGLPVIVSDKVGCNIDMVKNYNSGIIFKYNSGDSLKKAIDNMELNFSSYKKNVLSIDFMERDKEQVNTYLKLLSE